MNDATESKAGRVASPAKLQRSRVPNALNQSTLCILALGALALSACSREQVTAYRVKREKRAAPVATAATASAAPQTSAVAAELKWNPPGTWSAGPASTMRRGSYRIVGANGEADISISMLGGAAGGEAANLNRWRGQLQLAPISDTDLSSVIGNLSSNGLKMTVVDFAAEGANAQRILGAIVPVGPNMWFFKMMGPDAVVGAAKPEFLEFLRTVKPSNS